MRAKLLRRKAYGWDQKQEPDDGGDMNIEDTSTPVSEHKTPVNKMNVTSDPLAEKQFPWLGEHEHRYPSRGRG